MRLLLAGLAVLSVLIGSPAMAEEMTHKVAIQVSVNNKQTMNIALNNATNVIKHYGAANVEVEIVAYGPGLDLFLKDPDSNHFQQRLQTLYSFGNVQFGVCQNTMKARKISTDQLLEDAFVQKAIVPSGVVRLMELQEQGYAYVRP